MTFESGQKIFIDDTTLRDGEQTAGVVFTNSEKIHIAKMLDAIGVHQIEAGIPAMGGDELEVVQEIAGLGLKASVLAWNRAVIADIEKSLECGVKALAISLSASDIHIKYKLGKDRAWVLDTLRRCVEFAKSHNVYVSVNAEDASRADQDFLIEIAKAVKVEGADRIRYCDTVGVLEPFTTFERIKRLIDFGGLPVEMHTHNDFGMATANALAGLRAGAIFVNTTVGGLGERAGNAALEEVVMALKHLENVDLGIATDRLRELAEYVAVASNRDIPVCKAIIGTHVFAHESGIHADGVLKNPKAYEAFSPEEVGLTRQVIIGKHSGSHSILHKFQDEFDIALSKEEAQEILVQARKLSIRLKRALFEKELMLIYQDLKGEGQ